MPTLLEIPLGGQIDPPRHAYRALYANLMRWLSIADPALASAVHERPARKPFTISGMYRKRDAWWWRVTVLHDAVLEPLWTGALRGGPLDLNGTTYPIRWLDTRIVQAGYERLLGHARLSAEINLAFVSPTTFRAGSLDLPLPEPRAVFQSWLSRWNDFAPPACCLPAALLEVVHERVVIERIRHLHTERHDLTLSSPVGFVGQVTYTIAEPGTIAREELRYLNALADYAVFCGTGRKTTLGMGQTRRPRAHRSPRAIQGLGS